MTGQPSLSTLLQRFLSQPVTATEAGSVEPYDVATAFHVEPRTAWQETLIVLKAMGIPSGLPEMPPDWASHVRAQKPVKFLPMAVGQYPQQVSELSRLLDSSAQEPGGTLCTTSFKFDAMPAVTSNQEAARHWIEGRFTEAIALWQTLPDSAVKAFNLGMAHLSRHELDSAKSQLKHAQSLLPDESGWKALASLYLALAESEV